MSGPSDLPEAAPRRLESGSFSSGLTVPDFAACLQMGLRPVGLVQGFCAMQWGWYGAGRRTCRGVSPYSSPGGGQGGYSQSWRCPHGMVSPDHRAWGQNYEQTWVEAAWLQGFGSAYGRLIEEAKEVGAHGVIGVVDTSHNLADMNVAEFHILGTAVVVEGAPPPPNGDPWSTYLAGQRLAADRSRFMPISVIAAIARSASSGLLHHRIPHGGRDRVCVGPNGVHDVGDRADLRGRLAARSSAGDRARGEPGSDTLHGIHRPPSVRFGAGEVLE